MSILARRLPLTRPRVQQRHRRLSSNSLNSFLGLVVRRLSRSPLSCKIRQPALAMENEDAEVEVDEVEVEATDKKVYAQYNHVLPSRYTRWTSRECFEFMYSRPWQEVHDFYSDVVNGRVSLSALFSTKGSLVHDDTKNSELLEEVQSENFSKKDRTGRWARNNFKIVVSYHGASFDGWQRQPGLNTVQGLIEKSLGKFVDERKAKQLIERGVPVEGSAIVAGRTDKGVTALQQVCSFYTWAEGLMLPDIEDSINQAAPGKLRVVSVSQVSRAFHPNFSAKWRRYLYIFPLNDGEGDWDSGSEKCVETLQPSENPAGCVNQSSNDIIGQDSSEDTIVSDKDEEGSRPTNFSVDRVNRFLQLLEGKLLSYKLFARDTKPSRNIGPPTECFLYHARAAVTRLRSSEEEEGHGKGIKVMCIELVGNRFLRRMVRVVVATAIREAAAGADDDDVLIKLMDSTCRRATAPPAPPDGLCLVDVGYTEFDPRSCLIH